jgi:glycerol-3-phosphate dehydrogenase
VANYAEVVAFQKDHDKIVGVQVHDLLSDTSFNVKAKIVVNATGPWSDKLRKLDDPSAEPRLRPAKGIHIIVPRDRLRNREAVVIESRRDGRNMFVIPWGNLSLVGTTDTDYQGDLNHIPATKEDIGYLLEALDQTYPDSHITKDDIISLYASVRPLAAELGVSEDAVSRDQLIFESNSGLVSMIGGKLTTHRSMAKALVDQVSSTLEREYSTPSKHGCETSRFMLDYNEEELKQAVENLIQTSGLDAEIATHLAEAYGPGAKKVLEIIHDDPQLSSRIAPETPYIVGEILFAVRYEMAMRLIDFMFRRTQIAYRLRDHGRSVAQNLADIMSKELGWSAETLAKEMSQFDIECDLVEPH